MMLPAALSERLDALIDDLIMDGGIEAASLASILLTAKDSIARADHVTLSRKVWRANDELLAEFARNIEGGLDLSPAQVPAAPAFRLGAQALSSTPSPSRPE